MTLVYLGGAGRSGSTLVEALLARRLGAAALGEVRFFWQYRVRGDVLCGCGERLDGCAFWSSALDRAPMPPRPLDDLAALNRRLNRTRNWWRLGRDGRESRVLADAFGGLYRAAFEVAGATVAIDNSKVPSHLAILQAAGLAPRVLHLVRDGRAVAHSWARRPKPDPAHLRPGSRMPRRSLTVAALAWSVENRALEKQSAGRGAYARMRYEDLCSDPESALTRAVDELALASAGHGPPRTPEFHTVGGNPDRFADLDDGEPVVRLDEEWKAGLGTLARWWLTGLLAPSLRRYGYGL